jgi:hypothetical protein
MIYDQWFEEGVPVDQGDADNLYVEMTKVEVMVKLYIWRYGLVPRREVEFYLPLVNPHTGGRSHSFQLGGKMDGLEVVGPKRGRIIEDKFVASIQRPMIERLPLDAQVSEYVDALMAMGWTADVAYRHTRYPGVNPMKAKAFKTKDAFPGESLEEFAQRLESDVLERPDFYFDQQILAFPTRHMEDYRAGRYGISRMILNARLLQKTEGWQFAWPQNSSRCSEYGGCDFMPLCEKLPNAIDRYEVVSDNVELSEGESATQEGS